MNSRLSKLLTKYSLEKVPYACEIFDIGYKMDQEDSWLLGVKNVFDFLDTHAYPLLMESERLLHYDLKSVTKDFNQDILENQLAAPGHVLNGKKVEFIKAHIKEFIEHYRNQKKKELDSSKFIVSFITYAPNISRYYMPKYKCMSISEFEVEWKENPWQFMIEVEDSVQ